ncbi:QueT transporter family protein [Clostridium omnivorum]|uniref:QueT transporter family protein n=1 Tax=Clostridium omnivorum TaxID=1604902 RepID=A0ABQ5NAN5_9CLOT|nr:QueT transporter family protein [Clostridium sp. E14]GLC32110.1 hypothetical protein bsdE14_35200 [Clostridium sp. E14]
MNNKTRQVVFGGIIGALYAVMTILFAPISYSQVQVRIAEALTVLPFFSPYAVWGLFIGCIVSNLAGGLGIIDIVFGSLATLIAALITYYIGKSNIKFKTYLAPLPAVLVNAVIVAFVLKYTIQVPLFITMLWVALGESAACYILGLPLLLFIEKNKKIKSFLA